MYTSFFAADHSLTTTTSLTLGPSPQEEKTMSSPRALSSALLALFFHLTLLQCCLTITNAIDTTRMIEPTNTPLLQSKAAALPNFLQVGANAAVAGIPMLSPEKCATLSNAPPAEPILEKERCSLCDVIVENARKWNWVGHYSSMCEGVPPHALEWCEYYACKIAECSYFRSNTCKVINSVDSKQVVTMNPCPAKYLCSYCLSIPSTQVFGCFDGTIN